MTHCVWEDTDVESSHTHHPPLPLHRWHELGLERVMVEYVTVTVLTMNEQLQKAWYVQARVVMLSGELVSK